MNRQRLMLIIMSAVFISVAGVLYFGFFRTPGAPLGNAFAPLPVSPINAQALVSEDDLRILDDPRFKNLVVPPGIPIVVPPGSKANPFAPSP